MNRDRCRRIQAVAAMAWVIFSAGLAYGETEAQKARGVVRARHRAVISSEIAGRILTLPYRAGEVFSKGAILVSFDCRLLEAERERAAANLEGAEKKLENDRELERLNAIGALDLALDEAGVRLRRAELNIASISVGKCRITAPFSGRVVCTEVNRFESVQPRQELLEIVDTRSLELEIMVPSAWLSWLEPGIPFEAVVDETGQLEPGTVQVLGAVVDPVSKMVQVRGGLTQKMSHLVPGMSVTVHFDPPGRAGPGG